MIIDSICAELSTTLYSDIEMHCCSVTGSFNKSASYKYIMRKLSLIGILICQIIKLLIHHIRIVLVIYFFIVSFKFG